jgi:hypothetical protein
VTPVSSGVTTQGVTGVTSGLPSFTVSFDTSMNRASVERAIALYPGDYAPTSNPATNTSLGLTSMCNGNWRVRNPNAFPIAFNWDVYNTPQKGVGTVPANSDVFFNTTTGSNTVRVFVGSKQQAVKATNPAACSGNLFNFAWAGDSRSVTVTPTAAMVSSNRYTAAVSTNAKSDAGQALTQPYASSFTAQAGNETGTLVPGGSFTTPDGVVIAAPEGTIKTSVQVFGRRIDATKVSVPVPNEFSVVAMYQVGSPTSVGVYRGSFRIGLPVPDGLILDGLYVIGLIPDEQSADLNLGWVLYGGNTNSAERKIYVNDSSLDPTTVYAIVRANTTNPPPTSTIQKLQSPSLLSTSSTPDFSPKCDLIKAFGIYCDPNIVQVGQNSIKFNYEDFLSIFKLSEFELPVYLSAFILQNGQLKCNISTLAFHIQRTQNMYICVDSTGKLNQSDLSLEKVLRHEMFHAVQYGLTYSVGVNPSDAKKFPNGFYASRKWIIEGTAEAAVESTATQMNPQLRLNREIYPITTKIDTNTDAAPRVPDVYETQDFWVFAGRNIGSGTGLYYLKAIFKTGLGRNLADVQSGLETSGYTGGFAKAYWDWAKNQGYEKNTIFRADLGATCQLINATAKADTKDFDFDTSTFSETPTLDSYTSKVYQFTFNNTKSRTLAAKVTGPAKFKLYMIGDEPNCPGGNDGTPGEWKVFKNRQDSNKLVVIISNTGGGTSKLELEVRAPKLSSSSPSSLTGTAQIRSAFTFKNTGKADLTYTLKVVRDNPADTDNWLRISSSTPAPLLPEIDPDNLNAPAREPATVNVEADCNGKLGTRTGKIVVADHNDPTRMDASGNPIPLEVPVTLQCSHTVEQTINLATASNSWWWGSAYVYYGISNEFAASGQYESQPSVPEIAPYTLSQYAPEVISWFSARLRSDVTLVSTEVTQSAPDGCRTFVNGWNSEWLCGVVRYEVAY